MISFFQKQILMRTRNAFVKVKIDIKMTKNAAKFTYILNFSFQANKRFFSSSQLYAYFIVIKETDI